MPSFPLQSLDFQAGALVSRTESEQNVLKIKNSKSNCGPCRPSATKSKHYSKSGKFPATCHMSFANTSMMWKRPCLTEVNKKSGICAGLFRLRTMEFDMIAVAVKPTSEGPVDPAAISFVGEASVFKHPNAVRDAVIYGGTVKLNTVKMIFIFLA